MESHRRCLLDFLKYSEL